jgi:hypothetical protein
MWKPPITACTFWMPDAAYACLIVLMTPRWLQEVSTTMSNLSSKMELTLAPLFRQAG